MVMSLIKHAMLNAHKFKQTSGEQAKKEAAAIDCCG
jgi:hypothetical protein